MTKSRFSLEKFGFPCRYFRIYLYLCAPFRVMMHTFPRYSLNVGGRLLSLEKPVVMGILNVTPDSFFQHHEGEEAVRRRVRQLLEEGAAVVDVGACSTRPGSSPVGEEEEMQRLRKALPIVRSEAPDAILSVDTFRAAVARMCVEEFGVQIVNDVSGGAADEAMWQTVAELHVPYVLTHNTPAGETADDAYMGRFLRHMGAQAERLHELGVCDVLLDPGFGFGKTLEQNYLIMRNLEVLHELHLPLLVGISRKSMVYNLLGTTPGGALNGTTVLHTAALLRGAHILRVHDVKEARECIDIAEKLKATSLQHDSERTS